MTDPLLLETADRVLAATCTHAAIQAAERDGWAPDVWAAVAEVGLPWLSVPDAAGGVGGSLSDAMAMLRLAGAHAAPVPIAETGALAGWLLAGAGLRVDGGPSAVPPGRPQDTLALDGGLLHGVAHRVPWARAASRIVVLARGADGWMVAAVDRADCRIQTAVNLAGEPRDTVEFDGVRPTELAPAAPGVDADALRLRGALTRASLMAGALDALSRRTIAYTHEREQFGRPVARFQAVQIHLVTCAQEAALASVAAQAAAIAAERGPAWFEIASARLVAGRAAVTATRAAHQAHGAMGMTQEYPLHHLSRRLWAWRSEHGDEHAWSSRLGEAVVAAGADRLYPAITGGTAAMEA